VQYNFNGIFNKLKILRSKLPGIFDRKDFYLFLIRSLTPPKAEGNALAVSVQLGGTNAGKKLDEQKRDND
jgi:hypothetical protein